MKHNLKYKITHNIYNSDDRFKLEHRTEIYQEARDRSNTQYSEL